MGGSIDPGRRVPRSTALSARHRPRSARRGPFNATALAGRASASRSRAPTTASPASRVGPTCRGDPRQPRGVARPSRSRRPRSAPCGRRRLAAERGRGRRNESRPAIPADCGHEIPPGLRAAVHHHAPRPPPDGLPFFARTGAMALVAGRVEGLDMERCMKLALVHDMAEALVGDITPFDSSPHRTRRTESQRNRGACRRPPPRTPPGRAAPGPPGG